MLKMIAVHKNNHIWGELGVFDMNWMHNFPKKITKIDRAIFTWNFTAGTFQILEKALQKPLFILFIGDHVGI